MDLKSRDNSGMWAMVFLIT